VRAPVPHDLDILQFAGATSSVGRGTCSPGQGAEVSYLRDLQHGDLVLRLKDGLPLCDLSGDWRVEVLVEGD
jgi:hypothetical protein